MAVADTSKEPTSATTTTTTLSTSARRAAAPPPDLLIPKNLWRDRAKSTTHTAAAAPATSPERNRVWTEPSPKPRRVAVVYYLARRNGHLDHPHFMEVPLSSPDGLYLRDVMHRLNLLRGTGMAALYSWSAKRSYKSGFVWQDLAENDFIYPSHRNEYVLKGSELLHDSAPPLPPFSSSCSSSRPLESVSFRSPKLTELHCEESNFPSAVPRRRRNQSWSSIDLHEYKVYKTESPGPSAQRHAANASTQTDDRRRRARRQVREREVKEEVTCHDLPKKKEKERETKTTELTRDEITPPPSDSSPETLEKLMKADKRLVLSTSAASSNNALPAEDGLDRVAPESNPSGRMRASTVLMQLFSCGSFSFKDCGASYVKDQGLSLIGNYKPRLHRRAGNDTDTNSSCNLSIAGASGEISSFSGIKLEDKEYFSGSLLETVMNKRPELVPVLKRSSSYNENRTSSQVQSGEKDAQDDGARARCVPRKLRMQPVVTTGRLEQGNVAVASSSSSQGAGQEGLSSSQLVEPLM